MAEEISGSYAEQMSISQTERDWDESDHLHHADRPAGHAGERWVDEC